MYTVLWPRSATSAFLPALSQICRLFRASQVRERIRQARSSDEALAILETEPLPKFPSICILPASGLVFWCPGT
nr:hypothetical protein [Mesorhizobium sp.]